MLSTKLTFSERLVVIATTLISVALSVTEVGFLLLPTQAEVLCEFAISNKVINEALMQKYKKTRKKLLQTTADN